MTRPQDRPRASETDVQVSGDLFDGIEAGRGGFGTSVLILAVGG